METQKQERNTNDTKDTEDTRDAKGAKGRSYGRWLALTLGAVLLTLGILGGTVIWVDPFFHYHKPLSRLAYPIDSERYQNDGISRHFTYDAVLTGTSMTENFKASLFDSLFGVQSIKIPYAGGYYKEVDQAVRRALSYNPQVHTVMRGLDKSFLLYPKDQYNPAAPAPEYLMDGNPFNDVNYIFNKEVLFGTISGVFNRTRAGEHTTSFDEYMHWAPDKEWGKEAVLKTYERETGEREPAAFTDEDRRMVTENLEQNVLATAKANPQVTFYCFIPPYSISWWDSELMVKGEFRRQMEAYRLMADLLLECGNIRLFAFDDQFDITCDLDNYMDVIHYSEEVGDQLLEWMASGRHMLTKENADAYFDKITGFYADYDYDSIYE